MRIRLQNVTLLCSFITCWSKCLHVYPGQSGNKEHSSIWCMRNETLDFPQRNVMRYDSLSTYRHTALFSRLSKTSIHAMKVFYKMPQSVMLVCRIKRQFINDLFALSFIVHDMKSQVQKVWIQDKKSYRTILTRRQRLSS